MLSGKEVLEKVLEHLGLTPAAFANKIGLSRPQAIYDIQKGKTSSVSTRMALKIVSVFPELNYSFLMSGEGEMIKDPKTQHNAIPHQITQFVNVPIVTVRSFASYLRGYGDEEYVESLPTVPVLVDRNYRGKYLCFEVEGDSMDDGGRMSICDRDIILCRQVSNDLWQSQLHIRDWYFVIVHKGGVVCKQIASHYPDKGTIVCHSLNQLYEDFTLDLNDVIELYNVVKIVDRSVRL